MVALNCRGTEYEPAPLLYALEGMEIFFGVPKLFRATFSNGRVIKAKENPRE